MIEILINSLDIFFLVMMWLLYIAFIFFAKNITSKFFIFFISCFVNIFNYSIVIKNEYSFLTIVLLNIIFMLVVAIFYIYVDMSQENLSSNFIEGNDIKNLIIISIFVTSFIMISLIFNGINKKKNLFNNISINKTNILTTNKLYKKTSNGLEQKEILDINGQKFIVFTRNIVFIENNNIFLNYNLLIILYISVIIVVFFITNKKNTK